MLLITHGLKLYMAGTIIFYSSLMQLYSSHFRELGGQSAYWRKQWQYISHSCFLAAFCDLTLSWLCLMSKQYREMGHKSYCNHTSLTTMGHNFTKWPSIWTNRENQTSVQSLTSQMDFVVDVKHRRLLLHSAECDPKLNWSGQDLKIS